MTRKPHFQYFHVFSGNHVIVMNLRTGKGRRYYDTGKSGVTGLSLAFWNTHVAKGMAKTITRAKYRFFRKNGSVPVA